MTFFLFFFLGHRFNAQCFNASIFNLIAPIRLHPYTCTHTLAPQLPSPSARKTVSHGPHTLAPIHLHPNFQAPAQEKLSPTGPIHLHPYTCTPTSKPQRKKNCLPC